PMSASRDDFIFVDTSVGGVDHRNVIKRVGDLRPNGVAGVYTSWQRGPGYLKTWVETHRNEKGQPTVAGYDGPTWTPRWVGDLDYEDDPGVALQDLRKVIRYLDALDVPQDAPAFYFSGSKGFHVELPEALFGGFTPSAVLHRQLGRFAALLLKDVHSYDKK